LATRRRARKFFSRERKERWKEIGTVAAGGLVEFAVETAVDMSSIQFPDITPMWNTGDAVGALASVAVTMGGVYKKNKSLTLLGSGMLAMSMPSLLLKAIRQYVPGIPVQPILALPPTPSYGAMGKYGRHTVVPTSYRASLAYRRR
jgi:hypothetical protein